MVAFPDIETPFRRKARRLITPMAGRFDPADWESAFAQESEPTCEDRQLLEAALWVGCEVQALNDANRDLFGALSAEQAIALGVAMLNREYRSSLSGTRSVQAAVPHDQPVSFDYLTNIRYENDHGQRMSAADFIETGIESLASWIYDARRLQGPAAAESPELGAIAVRAAKFYSLRCCLKALFDEALHRGWHLAGDRDNHWIPRDRDLARLEKAWIIRANANFMSEPMKLATAWSSFAPSERRRHGLTRSVDEAVWRADGWHAKVRRKGFLSRRPDGRAIERAGLRDSYLSLFLDEDMPLAPGLTASLLHDAWWVIGHFTRKIGAASAAAMTDGTLSLLQGAFAVKRGELCRSLAGALNISYDCASDIVAFMSFRESAPKTKNPADDADGGDKGDRGLWSAPLIPLPDDVLLLPRAIFETGEAVYRVESWLEKGGIDDQAVEHRGDRYEVRCRADLVEAIDRNALLTSARIAPNGIPQSNDFPHQTDLLFMLGTRAFVGDIKCWLTPADPHHWDRFYRIRLLGAVQQALDRAAALKRRRDILAEALGIGHEAAAELEVCPLVATNLSAGFSLSTRGCRIVDAEYLGFYLRSPYLSGSVAMVNGRPTAQKVHQLYASEDEASNRFDAEMADPWSLRRFLDRMEQSDIAYPRPTGGGFSVETLFRGNLTDMERLEHAQLLAFTQGRTEP